MCGWVGDGDEMGKDSVVVVVVAVTVDYSKHGSNRDSTVDFVHGPDLVGEGEIHLYAILAFKKSRIDDYTKKKKFASPVCEGVTICAYPCD